MSMQPSLLSTLPPATAPVTIGILGTGWVGTSVAISVLHQGVAQRVLLSDLRSDVAEGEAMDLAQGAAFYPTATVEAVPFEGLLAADAIVIAAGRSLRPGETRLDLLSDNAQMMRRIGAQLRGYAGLVIVVSNPVDLITQILTDASGLPPARVVGTGTMLDTARLHEAIGRELNLSPQAVSAHVVGEHGDSEVVLWSSAHVGGRPLRQWPGWSAAQEHRLGEQVRRAGYEVFKRKGATNHAIGLVTATLLRMCLRGERQIHPVTRVQPQGTPWAGIALSLPAVLDVGGAIAVVPPVLSPEETTALDQSAAILREALCAIG